MLEKWESLTKKYAQAFLNLYGQTLSNQDLKAISQFEAFLQEKKQVYAYLCLSAIPGEKKLELLNKFSHQFTLPTSIDYLVKTLLEHRRIEFLGSIVKKILSGHKARQNIVFFSVFTSHRIDENEKANVLIFLQHIVNRKMNVEFFIDPSLICGMRVQSDVLLWERSIAKQLKIIKFDTLQQVRL